MGAVTDVLVRARLRYAESGGSMLDVLDWACQGDHALEADALELLDGCTPHPWTFLLYCHGARWEGEEVVFDYSKKRTRAEVLAVMGKACVRAARMEDAEAKCG